MYVRMDVCLSIHVCLFVCLCVCPYVCKPVCMYGEGERARIPPLIGGPRGVDNPKPVKAKMRVERQRGWDLTAAARARRLRPLGRGAPLTVNTLNPKQGAPYSCEAQADQAPSGEERHRRDPVKPRPCVLGRKAKRH